MRVVQLENSLYDPRIKYRQVEVRDAGYDWSNTRRQIWRNAGKKIRWKAEIVESAIYLKAVVRELLDPRDHREGTGIRHTHKT